MGYHFGYSPKRVLILIAGNTVRVLLPPTPTWMTLADHLHVVLPWVMEVATYCIHLGAASAMDAT